MSKVAIGLGAALALVVVIFLIIELTGEDTPVDESLGGSPPEEIPAVITPPLPNGGVIAPIVVPPDPPPPCSEYVCEDNYDNKEGNGETSEECCEKKLCTDLSTPPSCPEGQELDQFTRGDTVGQCCKVPYCSADLCDTETQRVRDNIRSTDADVCCRDLPTCADFSRCPPGEELKPASEREDIYGDTSNECCNPKTCSDNGWDTKCRAPLAPGMTWSATSADILGNTKEECCTPGSCADNGWAGAVPADPGVAKCKSSHFGGSAGSSPIMTGLTNANPGPLGIIYGNTVSECCITKPCKEQNPVWDNAKCEAEGGETKKLKNNGNEEGAGVDICCEDKTCSDWTTECPTGQKAVAGDTVGYSQETCCEQETCGEHYTGSDPCSGQNFIPDALVGADPRTTADGKVDNNPRCCSNKKCNDPSGGLDTKVKCNDKSVTIVDNAIAGESIMNGVSLYDVQSDLSNKDLSWSQCCKPDAKCSDVYPDSDACPTNKKIKDGERDTLIDEGGEGDKDLQYAVDLCCESKKCGEVAAEGGLTCPEHWVQDIPDPDVNFVDPGDGESVEDANVCCSINTCADNGWDNAKCKDRRYTAAANRGKLKSGARGYGPDHPMSTAGTPYDANGELDKRSDEHCCEQDLKNNFARTCIHNELDKNGNIHRKSTGAIALWNRVAGKAIVDRTGLDAERCKALCDGNARCNSFWVDLNGRCMTLPGFTSHESTVRSSGSPLPTDPERPGENKLDWEYFAPIEAGSHSYSQYYNGNAFPEDKRYSGGKHDGQTDFGKKEGCIRKIDGNIESGCEKSSGGSPTLPDERVSAAVARQRAAGKADWTKNSWDKREEILLGGVDEEFCPFHFVHSYAHTSNTYPSDLGSLGPGAPLSAESNAQTMAHASGPFSRTEEDAYPEWTAGCVTNRRLGDHYDGCWDDPNCRKFMTHVNGSAADTATQHRFLQTPHIQQYFMERTEHRRACVKHHVGSDTTTSNDGRSGHSLHKSIHINNQETDNSKKYVHGVLPPKAAVSHANQTPAWGPVPSKMLIAGDSGTGDASV